MIALYQNVANCRNTQTVLTSEVGDLSLRWMNGSNVYDRCGHDTRQFYPSCTACRRSAILPGPAWQNETCSQPHHSNHLANFWHEATPGQSLPASEANHYQLIEVVAVNSTHSSWTGSHNKQQRCRHQNNEKIIKTNVFTHSLQRYTYLVKQSHTHLC